MSFFDAPKDRLNPTLWDNNNVIHPNVAGTIKHMLLEFFPADKISHIILLGSNVTHQYSDSSDIDVNVVSTPGEKFDTWHKIFKEHNSGKYFLPGTKHPVNFFFQEYIPDRDMSFDNALGAYDLQRNIWLKQPIPAHIMRDMISRQAQNMQYAGLYQDMFKAMARDLARKFVQLKKYKKGTPEYSAEHEDIMRTLQDLLYQYNKLDQNRKLTYRYVRTPALSENNMLFKYIEHGAYGPILKILAHEDPE